MTKNLNQLLFAIYFEGFFQCFFSQLALLFDTYDPHNLSLGNRLT